MPRSLGSNWLAARDRAQERVGERLRDEEYIAGLAASFPKDRRSKNDSYSFFRKLLDNAFLSRQELEYERALLSALKVTLGSEHKPASDDVVADSLGCENRTSVVHWRHDGGMSGKRLVQALLEVGTPTLASMPSREQLACAGYAEATTVWRDVVDQEARKEPALGAQEFALLLCMLGSPIWHIALANNELTIARKEAGHILATVEGVLPDVISTARERDQLRTLLAGRTQTAVFALRDLELQWGDHAAIALTLIPERVPNVSGDPT